MSGSTVDDLHMKYSLEDTDIEYISSSSLGKPIYTFCPDYALAHLLLNEKISSNTNHWEREWPEAAQNTFAMVINCNDFFGYGADGQEFLRGDVELVYRMWRHEPAVGLLAWCVIERKTIPIGKGQIALARHGWDLNWLMSVSKEDALQRFRKGPTEWYT